MSYRDDLMVIKYLGTYFYVSPDKTKKLYTIKSTVPELITENVTPDKIQEAVQKQVLLNAAHYNSSRARKTVAELEAEYPFKKWAEISTGNKELKQVLLGQLNFE